MHILGIDARKNELWACLLSDDKEKHLGAFPNSELGVGWMLAWVNQYTPIGDVQICIESDTWEARTCTRTLKKQGCQVSMQRPPLAQLTPFDTPPMQAELMALLGMEKALKA